MSSKPFESLGRGVARRRQPVTDQLDGLRPPSVKDISGDVSLLVSRLLSSSPNLGLPQRPIAKSEALIHLWNCMLRSDIKREELMKINALPHITSFLSSPSTEERYGAAGVLHGLALTPRYIWDIMAPAHAQKVMSGCLGILDGDHDLSKGPVVKLLQQVATRPKFLPLVEQALPQLVQVMTPSTGRWADKRQCVAAAVLLVRQLLTSPVERPEVVEGRKVRLLQLRALGPLIEALHCGMAAVVGEAAEVIRVLATLADFTYQLLDPPHIPRLLAALPTCTPRDWGYLCGTLWEGTAEVAVAAAVAAADPVPFLLVILRTATRELQRARKHLEHSAWEQYQQQAKYHQYSRIEKPPLKVPLPPDLDIAVCNATGVLCHLSFLDPIRAQITQLAVLPLLSNLLLLTTNMHTYENVAAVLWNVGMVEEHRGVMKAAGVPRYLVKTVPVSWTTTGKAAELQGPKGTELPRVRTA